MPLPPIRAVLGLLLVLAAGPAGSEGSDNGAAGAGAFEPVEGVVVSTRNVSSYTYVQLETPGGVVWAAVPRTALDVGERIRLHHAAPMHDFYSPSLERRFERIYFATSVERLDSEGAARGAPAPCAEGEEAGAPVARAPAGYTVAEIVDRSEELAGERVTLRARVVKVNRGVLGRNWLHLRDGTRSRSGVSELTATALGDAGVGCVVTVHATLVADADFGYGYRYPLLLEDATLEAE